MDKHNPDDVKVTGNPDLWVLICKASSKSGGWVESTKAMQMPSGCLVQVSTKEGDKVAEALQFVPGVKIDTDENGQSQLVPMLAFDLFKEDGIEIKIDPPTIEFTTDSPEYLGQKISDFYDK